MFRRSIAFFFAAVIFLSCFCNFAIAIPVIDYRDDCIGKEPKFTEFPDSVPDYLYDCNQDLIGRSISLIDDYVVTFTSDIVNRYTSANKEILYAYMFSNYSIRLYVCDRSYLFNFSGVYYWNKYTTSYGTQLCLRFFYNYSETPYIEEICFSSYDNLISNNVSSTKVFNETITTNSSVKYYSHNEVVYPLAEGDSGRFLMRCSSQPSSIGSGGDEWIYDAENINVPPGHILIIDRYDFVTKNLIDPLPLQLHMKSVMAHTKPMFKAWTSGALYGFNTSFQAILDSNTLPGNQIVWAQPVTPISDKDVGGAIDFDGSSMRYFYLVNPAFHFVGKKQYYNNVITVSLYPPEFRGRIWLISLSTMSDEDIDDGVYTRIDNESTAYMWLDYDEEQGIHYDDDSTWWSLDDIESIDVDDGDVPNPVSPSVPTYGGNVEIPLVDPGSGTFVPNAINSVTSLIQYGSTFMLYVRDMFTWLPPVVQIVVAQALILYMVVAVFKLFRG